MAPLAVCRTIQPLLGSVHQPLLYAVLRHAKQAHYAAAGVIVVGAVVHSLAHVVNAVQFSKNYDIVFGELNWAKYKGENPFHLIMRSWAGITGVLMVSLLSIISFTSSRQMRHKHHGTFWLAHQVAVPCFLLLLLLHPLSGVLKQKISHVSSENNNKSTYFYNTTVSDVQYQPIKTKAWICPSFGFMLYVLDILWKYFWIHNKVELINAKCLLGGAVQLILQGPRKPMSIFRPGQYVLLKCAQISRIEYHPFTVARCPNSPEGSFSIIVSQQGDWTFALCRKVKLFMKCTQKNSSGDLLSFSIIGPLRSPLEQVIKCNIVICVAAGAGITPFAAVIQKLIIDSNSVKPRRIHLIWVVRRSSQINWFADVINNLYDKFWNANEPDRLHIILHVTQSDTENDISGINSLKYPILRKICYEGKPHWNAIFAEIVSIYQNKLVSVFCCGPKRLNHTIKQYCKKCNKLGYNLNYIQETF